MCSWSLCSLHMDGPAFSSSLHWRRASATLFSLFIGTSLPSFFWVLWLMPSRGDRFFLSFCPVWLSLWSNYLWYAVQDAVVQSVIYCGLEDLLSFITWNYSSSESLLYGSRLHFANRWWCLEQCYSGVDIHSHSSARVIRQSSITLLSSDVRLISKKTKKPCCLFL